MRYIYDNRKYQKELFDEGDGHQGLFWVTDLDEPDTFYFYKVDPAISHRRFWEGASFSRKPYNYFPRGRVVKKRNKYIIFINPTIATDEVINLIIDFYDLDKDNTFVHVDGSNHYSSYLDKEK